MTGEMTEEMNRSVPDKYRLLQTCLTGLLAYEDCFDTVPQDFAPWVCERLAWHKVLPLAAAVSDGMKPKCTGIKEIFHAVTLKNLLREEAYRRQAETVFKALAAAGIHFVPFKGPFWMGRLYGAYHWRHIGDMDLFLNKRDIPHAACVLAGMGYAAHTLEGSIQEDLIRRGELAFFPGAGLPGAVPVELHWDLMPSPRFLRKRYISAEDLTGTRQTAQWQGLRYPLPRPEIQLFYYMLHAACQHQFMRFVHLMLLVHFIESYPDLDWDWFLDLVISRKAQAPVYACLQIVRKFWRLPAGACRVQSAVKPPLRTRFAPVLLPPDLFVRSTPKRGALRRKLFRAMMSW